MDKLTEWLNTVQCMDNVQGMRALPNECIDLVVTSPPYDDLRTYGGHSWSFYDVLNELTRIIKQGGVIVWIVADATINGSETGTSFRQALAFMGTGFNLHDTMIWKKPNPFAHSEKRYISSFEYMFVLTKGAIKTWSPIKKQSKRAGCVDLGARIKKGGNKINDRRRPINELRVLHNVWDIAASCTREEHPAQFPVEIPLRHIQTWTNEGDIVLDPFMGSGTTAQAAQKLNRNYIGFEINPDYIEICDRKTSQYSLAITG